MDFRFNFLPKEPVWFYKRNLPKIKFFILKENLCRTSEWSPHLFLHGCKSHFIKAVALIMCSKQFKQQTCFFLTASVRSLVPNVTPAINWQDVLQLTHTHTRMHTVTRHSHLTGQYHWLCDWFVLFPVLREAHHTKSWGAFTTLLWLPLGTSWPGIHCSLAGGYGVVMGSAWSLD